MKDHTGGTMKAIKCAFFMMLFTFFSFISSLYAAQLSITPDSLTGTEGDTLTFTVQINEAQGELIEVFYSIAGSGTYPADPSDYSSGTSVTIPAGSTSVALTVDLTDDNLVENDEEFTVSLNSVSPSISVTISATEGSATGTIVDNDTSEVSITAPTPSTGSEGSSLEYTIALSKAVSWDVAVDYSISGSGTYPADLSDYSSGTSVTIPAGSTIVALAVDLTDDNLVENDEEFTVSLNSVSPSTSVTISATEGSATGTIVDNDTSEVSITAPTPSTGSEGSSLEYTIALSKAVSWDVTVDYLVTGSGTYPADPSDYSSGTSVTIPAGSTIVALAVDLTDDNLVENDEEFTVSLNSVSPSTSVTISATEGSATGTIVDNDYAQLSIDDVSVYEHEGSAVFTVTSDKEIDPSVAVTFEYVTVDGSAESPSDYAAISTTQGSISGGSEFHISVTIENDEVVETDETFTVRLSDASGPVTGIPFAKDTGVGTILNDDHRIDLSTSGGQGTLSTTSGYGGGATAPPDAFIVVSRDTEPHFEITITDTCFHVHDVTVNGNPQGPITSFTFPPVQVDNQTIHADFAINQYSITASVYGNHGSLTAGQTVDCDTSGYEYIAVADPGYHISWLKVNGADVPVGHETETFTYTFATGITENQTIEVAFSQKIEIVDDSPYGSITPAGDENKEYDVEYGSNQTFVITAFDPCPDGLGHHGNTHHISKLLVDGVPVAAAEGQSSYAYTFTNITENHSIEALFTSYVDITVGANGSVEAGDPITVINAGTSDSIEVEAEESLTVKAVPVTGFHVAQVKIDGVIVGHPELYVFENLLNKDSTYEVAFAIDTYVIEPVSRFDTIFETSSLLPPKAVARTVDWGSDASFYIRLDDPQYAVYGVLVDNVSYPIPASGASVTYTDFVLSNVTGNYLQVEFTNVRASHRLEVQDFDTSPLSDVPLDAKLRPKPASLMFLLDDSGSMDWEVVTSSNDGLYNNKYYIYSYPNTPRARVYSNNSLQASGDHDRWSSQWSEVNKMFYNPDVTYQPWPNFTGTPSSQLPAVAADGLAHANIYRPRLHPWHSQDCTDAINLANGDAGADLANCNTTTHNNHTFPMDAVFLQYADASKRKIVDNTDSGSFTFSGNWGNSTATGQYGTNYKYTTAGSAVDIATWEFTVQESAVHEVFVWWVETSSRRTDVPYTVSCTNCGPSGITIEVNQRNTGRDWFKLVNFLLSTAKQ
jgi:hypothetical protein